MNDDIECPYCGEWSDINHDDGYGYEEDEIFTQECIHCGRDFIFYTSTSFSYDVHMAPPCVGDADKHDLQPNDVMIKYGFKDAKDCAHEHCDHTYRGIWKDLRKPTKEES